MGVMAYAPLASGFLTGKYTRTAEGPTGPGRLDPVKALPRIPGNRDQDWDVLETLQRVAGELGRPASQVAVNWVAQRPGVAATLVGARTVTQLENNIAALEFSLSPEQQADLDAAGQLDLPQPYSLFAGELHRQAISGGLTVRAEPEWFRTQR
ncbi:aryl-alcohol dehydrogenase-like predicted oxidoreductase [Lipingzhangella halophila]|uniref:Aryl-alcohol dehydrogenase-like predicted oxidoreductase n=1 Tax=Lipingzhangella halophila TaxID=1783352 RepID=A0A7W7W3L5_9ACTN|nr:aryl-alcohol dehydrogenase-like predicted oxidoreductase [Lipingzhangella halophila]